MENGGRREGSTLRPCRRRAIRRLCPLCRQGLYREKSIETFYMAQLIGAVRYGMCPECFLEVPPPWSPAYRLRYDLKVEELRRLRQAR